MTSTRFALLVSVLLLAVACSDEIPGGDTLQNTLTGVVSLGAPVSNATITIAAMLPNGTAGDVLTTTTSDAEGVFTATYARTAAAYTVVCATGGLSVDLATARPLSLASTSLCAAMPSGASSVAVTAWSTLALALAQQRATGGAAIADAVTSAKADWNQYLACSDPSRNVVDAAPKNPTGEDAAGTLDETLLSGLAHGALSQSAVLVSERYSYTPGVRFTPLSLVSGAAQDLQTDGILNGQNNGTVALQDYVFTSATFRGAPEGVAAGLQAFVASPVNTSGASQTDIDTYANCISVNQSPIFGGAGDNDAPLITLVELNPSTVVDGVQTIHGPTTLKITAVDGSGIATIVATSTVLTLGPDTASAAAEAIYGFDTTGAPDGQTVIAIAVTDNAGNTATRDLLVHVSNAPPAVTLDGGAARFVTSASFQATGTVANPSAIASLAFSINGTPVAQLNQPSATWSQALTMTCDTSASLLVVVTDVVGKTVTLSQTVTCDAYDPEIALQTAQYYPVDRLAVAATPAGDSLIYTGHTGPVATAAFNYATTDGSGAQFTAYANRLDYLPSQGRTEVTNNLPYLAFTIGDTGEGAAVVATPPEQLILEYRYLFNGAESRGWTALVASSAVLRLPISYQTLNPTLASRPSDVHHVQLRVTDAAGRAAVRNYYFRLTAHLPPVVANSCTFALPTGNVGFGFSNVSPRVYYQQSGAIEFADLRLSLPLDLPADTRAPRPTVTVSGSAVASTRIASVGVIVGSPSTGGSACTSACLSGCIADITSSVPPLAGAQCIPDTPAQYQLWKTAGVYSYAVSPPAWFVQSHATSFAVGPAYAPTTGIATVQAGGSLFARIAVNSPRFAIDGTNTTWPDDPSASVYMGTGVGYKPASGQTATHSVRYYATALGLSGNISGLVLSADGFVFPAVSLVRSSDCLGGVSRTIRNTGQWPDS